MGKSANWNGSWIWSQGETEPRNEWRCFRGSLFLLEGEEKEAVTVKITADSRYVLYVNGSRVGRGPVRSWPFELAYDEYRIGHLLHEGQQNVIAVLVTHYGIPTFQYLRGRGGLLLQVEGGAADARRTLLATGSAWRTAVHQGYDPHSSRISCQLPFTERVDARQWEEAWTEAGYDDSRWEAAAVIGPAGMEPWVKLVERDIPPLTEEPVQPVRVESLKRVQARSWGVVLDLRSHFVPSSEHHANNVEFCGYIAAVIRTRVQVKATIGFPDGGRLSGPFSLNGVWLDEAAYYGSKPERYMDVELKAGDNFFLMDVHGITHGHGFHMGIHCREEFQVVSPWEALQSENTGSSGPIPFVSVGPFEYREIIDHQPETSLGMKHPDYIRVREISSVEELAVFRSWVKPVEHRYGTLEDVFGACVWKPFQQELAVPYSLQNAVIAHDAPAELPLYPDEDTELVIDFGKEYSGYVEFTVDAAEGTVLDLYGFEYMKDGWRQETYGLDNTLRYVCREGRQTYSSLVRRGFRYLMATVRGHSAARPVKLHQVRVLQSNYPIAEIGRFQCSDPLLNDIWQMSRHTTRLCMEDTFVDCPAFEQAFWVGDARNEALVNYYMFGDKEIVRRCLRLVPGSRFQSPLYADQVPSGWSSVIPNWTFFWAVACEEYAVYSGDRSFVEEVWPHVSYTLEHYLQRLDGDGLLNIKGWNLLDWAPIDQPNNGIVTHQNMFLVKALEAASRLGAGLDRPAADALAAKAGELRRAINDRLWSADKQAYVDCIHGDGRVSDIFSVQTQVVAFLCGIPEGVRLKRVEEAILTPPAGFVRIGSAFMSFFYHEVLMKLGKVDVLLEDIRREYGQMVDEDASACWEMYPKPLEQRAHPNMLTRSHCHAWSAGPGYFLGLGLLGVRGGDEGWRKVTVEPQVADLDWARGTVPLPGGGRIDVSWRADRRKGRFHLRVAAPADVELDIVTPEGFEAAVEEVRLG